MGESGDKILINKGHQGQSLQHLRFQNGQSLISVTQLMRTRTIPGRCLLPSPKLTVLELLTLVAVFTGDLKDAINTQHFSSDLCSLEQTWNQ